MFNKLNSLEVEVPDGFAITVKSYRDFLSQNNLIEQLKPLLDSSDSKTLYNLSEVGSKCRELIAKGEMSDELKRSIANAYRHLQGNQNSLAVAVRSSATAEDLPKASFAGQHDSFLNVKGEKNLFMAVKKCYESLFNDRAIKYRIDNGFDHMQVGLSIGVQYMVRSDKACTGVIFTLDPESGFKYRN